MVSPVEPRPGPASPDRNPAAPTTTVDSDWTVQVTDTIESVVGSIRDKTAVPAETVARGLVYGIVIAAAASAAAVLLTIGMVRLLDNVFRIWAVYAILGGVFTSLGLFLWRKRRPPRRA